MMLPITLTIAGACALLAAWLAFRVGQVRRARGINLGDGGDPALVARMRAQANFTEYTPLVLILLGLIEAAKGPQTWLWGAGIVYVVARVLHPFGMDRPAPNPLRLTGIGLTLAVLVMLGVDALLIAYAAVPRAGAA